ncbi:MAG: hypothetical protein HGB08_02690 [Candidatus Moranbacteria bacterium]|nr:hypothetical protein [Candidatus Moranbacteria bacterium]
MKNKILIWDTSGIDPVRYSLKEDQIQIEKINAFYAQAGLKTATSSECVSCEFTYEHNNQRNILVESIANTSCISGKSGTVFLAANGDFSYSFYGSSISVNVIYSKTEGVSTLRGGTLWKNSCQWTSNLSIEDKSLITITGVLDYSDCAILTNDKGLRKQCDLEGVKNFGTCSMLAGMVISNIISYQKGTIIFKNWAEKDKRWIPKRTFAEILNIERDRFDNGSSFWVN